MVDNTLNDNNSPPHMTASSSRNTHPQIVILIKTRQTAGPVCVEELAAGFVGALVGVGAAAVYEFVHFLNSSVEYAYTEAFAFHVEDEVLAHDCQAD